MKNKKIGLLLMFPLAMAALAGCGDNGGSSNNITIKFWHTFGQTVQDGLKPKIATFKQLVKEHDGVDVEIEMVYQGGYDDVAKKIADGYSVGNRPTISVAYPDNVSDYLEIAKSAGQEFVVNLEPFIQSETVGFGKETWLGDVEDDSDFIQDFMEEGRHYSVEGTYSLPYMKSTEIMFYNINMMQTFMPNYKPEVGNSETKIRAFMNSLTWDQFMDLARYVNEHKADISNVLEVPVWYDSDANFLITKMYQNRIPYSSVNTKTGKGVIEFGIEDEEHPSPDDNRYKTISLLKELNGYRKEGLLTTKGIENTYGSDFFTGEKCLFSIGSSGGSGYNFPQADAFQLGVCRVPASNNNPLYVSQGPTLAIFSDSGLDKEVNKNTVLYAWKFVKYITNGQVNAEVCVNGSEGYIPVRSSAYETPFFQQFMEEGESYAKCYEVIINDINIDAGYLVAPTFKGSAALRDECGALLTAAIQCTEVDIDENHHELTDKLSSLIDLCIDNARQKF